MQGTSTDKWTTPTQPAASNSCSLDSVHPEATDFGMGSGVENHAACETRDRHVVLRVAVTAVAVVVIVFTLLRGSSYPITCCIRFPYYSPARLLATCVRACRKERLPLVE